MTYHCSTETYEPAQPLGSRSTSSREREKHDGVQRGRSRNRNAREGSAVESYQLGMSRIPIICTLKPYMERTRVCSCLEDIYSHQIKGWGTDYVVFAAKRVCIASLCVHHNRQPWPTHLSNALQCAGRGLLLASNPHAWLTHQHWTEPPNFPSLRPEKPPEPITAASSTLMCLSLWIIS